MIDYKGKDFDIYNGFEDNEKIEKLTRDNQFYCNICNKLNDAEVCNKIIYPPNKLLINLDFGKNKKFVPNKIKFGEEIDITKYVNFNFGAYIKYRIIGVCSHFGNSGRNGVMLYFIEIVKMKNGIFLMILHSKKPTKVIFIIKILIYYYMKEPSRIIPYYNFNIRLDTITILLSLISIFKKYSIYINNLYFNYQK